MNNIDLFLKLQSLFCIIEEGIALGIRFDSLRDAIESYCEPYFIEPDYFCCESFDDVVQLLLQQYPHLLNYPY